MAWWGRRGRSGPLGLRARVMLLFGALALGLSAVLATLTWILVSHVLLSERESSATARAVAHAETVQRELDGRAPDVARVLESISGPRATLVSSHGWYSTTASAMPSDLPDELVRQVRAGESSTQRVELDRRPNLVIGVPLRDDSGGYFEMYDLTVVSRTYDVLAASLAAAAAMTLALGLVLGRFATVRALRPLGELNAAASAVAAGRLGTRLDGGGDPDLEPLSRSFNATADALEQRVRVDARFAADVSHELRTPLTTCSTRCS